MTEEELARLQLAFDFEAGLAAKDTGTQAALDNAPAEWKDEAYRVIVLLALSGRPFTSEDLTIRVGLPSGEVGTNRNNAVGAVINAAAREGLIKRTGTRRLSQRRASHAAELAEWIGAE